MYEYIYIYTHKQSHFTSLSFNCIFNIAMLSSSGFKVTLTFTLNILKSTLRSRTITLSVSKRELRERAARLIARTLPAGRPRLGEADVAPIMPELD